MAQENALPDTEEVQTTADAILEDTQWLREHLSQLKTDLASQQKENKETIANLRLAISNLELQLDQLSKQSPQSISITSSTPDPTTNQVEKTEPEPEPELEPKPQPKPDQTKHTDGNPDVQRVQQPVKKRKVI